MLSYAPKRTRYHDATGLLPIHTLRIPGWGSTRQFWSKESKYISFLIGRVFLIGKLVFALP